MTKNSASRVVQEALPASGMDGFGRQLGADWRNAECHSFRAGTKALPTGVSGGGDPAKKVAGRKQGLAVDVLGLVIAVTVLAASAHLRKVLPCDPGIQHEQDALKHLPVRMPLPPRIPEPTLNPGQQRLDHHP